MKQNVGLKAATWGEAHFKTCFFRGLNKIREITLGLRVLAERRSLCVIFFIFAPSFHAFSSEFLSSFLNSLPWPPAPTVFFPLATRTGATDFTVKRDYSLGFAIFACIDFDYVDSDSYYCLLEVLWK